MFGIVVSMLAMVCKGMRQLQHCCISNVWHRCVHAGSGVQRDATTPNTVGSAMFGIVVSMQAGRCAKGCDNSNIVASAMFGIVVSMLAVVCKGMQQLPTLLGQQCLELLCPCRQAGVQRDATTPTLLHQQCLESLCLCWQWCAKGCNNSQRYLDLQCIVGRIQPIRLSNNKRWGLLVQQLGVVHQQCCVHLYGALFLVT